MNKADIIDVCADSIGKTIGDEWKHQVGIWGASGRHLNFVCDNKEYVLVLTEVEDGHHWSEYLGSDCVECPTTNREKLLKKISEWGNTALANLVADRLCVEEIDGELQKCDGLCRDCFKRWLNEKEGRDE